MVNLGQFFDPNKSKPVQSQPERAGLLASNPYVNRDYYESPWQSFLGSLGFRTGADAWRENMATQAAEYDAQIALKKYDEEYNLPINQVARMRAAGINPDLNGGQSIDPGSAAAVQDDPSTPIQSQGEEGVLIDVANGALSAFSTALGMVGTIQGVQRNHLDNLLALIRNEDEFSKYAKSISGSLLPPSPQPDGIQNFDWKSIAVRNAETFAQQQLPKKMRSKFVDFQKQYWDSAFGEGDTYETFRNRINSRKGYFLDSNVNYSEVDDVLMKIVSPIADATEKLISQNLDTELAQSKAAESAAETEKDYQDSLNGKTMAAAQNASNKSASESKESLSVVQGTIKDILKGLKVSSKKKGLEGALSSIALALISGMYLYTQSGIHPSVSSSQSPSGASSRSISF